MVDAAYPHASSVFARQSLLGFTKTSPVSDRLVQARMVIELAVTRVFDVESKRLAAENRGVARIAEARQVAMYLAHVACGLSLTDVGRAFGRDRTTVAHACAVIEDRRDDLVFDRALDLLEWMVPVMAVRIADADLKSSNQE